MEKQPIAGAKRLSLFTLPRLGKPKYWHKPKQQTLTGAYQKNERLADLKCMAGVIDTFGPESLAVDRQGNLYSGFEDGSIYCFDKTGSMPRLVVNTGGRPLGIRVHPQGYLVVCDAMLGLLKITVDGVITLLSNQAEGLAFGFADDLDISQDGRFIYFSDASSKWNYKEDVLDLIEHGGHGRLLCFDMLTQHTAVLMRGLQFANGVTLGEHEDYVLVVETGMYRVHRYWLKGILAGKHDIWIDNLPGFPDNIRFNGKDRFWVAIPQARNPILDYAAQLPMLRLVLMQLARVASIPEKHISMALGFNLQGQVVCNLQSHAWNNYNFMTQVLETTDGLYFSSLKEKTLAFMPLSQLQDYLAIDRINRSDLI